MTKSQKIKNVKALTMAYANLERVEPEIEDVNKAKGILLKVLNEIGGEK